MKPEISKDQVFSVKIYFINPIELISVITDTLIKLEFETYTVDKKDRGKLLNILDKNIRNVLFISVLSELELGFWVDYIERVFRIEHTFIQIGVFAYNLIKMEEKFSFLERGIPVIPFAEIRKNTLDVMKKILYYFEAKGTRKFIRVRAFGKTEAFFDIEGTHKPINGKIIDISAYAFSCQIQLMHAPFFTVGEILHNVLLVLKGARVRTTVKLIGISKVNPQVHVFKYHREKMVNNKTVNKKGLSIQNKNKVHNYIRLCLKENLKKQLEEVIEYTDN